MNLMIVFLGSRSRLLSKKKKNEGNDRLQSHWNELLYIPPFFRHPSGKLGSTVLFFFCSALAGPGTALLRANASNSAQASKSRPLRTPRIHRLRPTTNHSNKLFLVVPFAIGSSVMRSLKHEIGNYVSTGETEFLTCRSNALPSNSGTAFNIRQ